MTRITTADASKVSPQEFFDGVFGTSPETRAARREQQIERCIKAIERGDTYGWPALLVQECIEIMAERDSALTNVAGDPMKRRAAR